MMTSDPNEKAKSTFLRRAEAYDHETSWVTSTELISPLVPDLPSIESNTRFRFLDLCSGTGRVATLAASRGYDTIAYDQSIEMLSKIEDERVISILGNGKTLPFLDQSFDVTAMRQALHYFEIDEMMKEMARVTKRQLRLGHITTHDDEDVPLWTEYFLQASPGRKTVFRPGQIMNAATRLGLNVIDVQVRSSMDWFDGPIKHLGSDVVNSLFEKFCSAPERIVSRYFLNEKSLETRMMKLRWEFITIDLQSNAAFNT